MTSGGARASAVAFGCDGRVAGADGGPRRRDASGSSATSGGAWSSRGCCCGTRARARVAEIEVIGEPLDYTAAALCELDEPLEPDRVDVRERAAHGARPSAARDRSPSSPMRSPPQTTTWQPTEQMGRCDRVLAICADDAAAPSPVCESERGGFALISHDALVRAPGIARHFTHIVVLDPPACARADELIRTGDGLHALGLGRS